MKRLPLVLISLLLLTGCGKYDFKEVYRYPCQDPANWETPECTPPQCEAYGVCTKDVMKDTPLYSTTTTQEESLTSENK
jgi:hypothetical protein